MFTSAPVFKHCKPVTFLRVRDQVSYPHGRKVETVILYILSLRDLWNRKIKKKILI
jgi:hypothetical protein